MIRFAWFSIVRRCLILQEVLSQIWATLYDYPCLKNCDGIVKYVKECIRVAWGLVNQVRVCDMYYQEQL